MSKKVVFGLSQFGATEQQIGAWMVSSTEDFDSHARKQSGRANNSNFSLFTCRITHFAITCLALHIRAPSVARIAKVFKVLDELSHGGFRALARRMMPKSTDNCVKHKLFVGTCLSKTFVLVRFFIQSIF